MNKYDFTSFSVRCITASKTGKTCKKEGVGLTPPPSPVKSRPGYSLHTFTCSWISFNQMSFVIFLFILNILCTSKEHSRYCHSCTVLVGFYPNSLKRRKKVVANNSWGSFIISKWKCMSRFVLKLQVYSVDLIEIIILGSTTHASLRCVSTWAVFPRRSAECRIGTLFQQQRFTSTVQRCMQMSHLAI